MIFDKLRKNHLRGVSKDDVEVGMRKRKRVQMSKLHSVAAAGSKGSACCRSEEAEIGLHGNLNDGGLKGQDPKSAGDEIMFDATPVSTAQQRSCEGEDDGNWSAIGDTFSVEADVPKFDLTPIG